MVEEDCESIEKVLNGIEIAEIYSSFGGKIQKENKRLEQLKKELGC